jgi:hypothetical protein
VLFANNQHFENKAVHIADIAEINFTQENQDLRFKGSKCVHEFQVPIVTVL